MIKNKILLPVVFLFSILFKFSIYFLLKNDLYFSSSFVDEIWVLEHLDGRDLSLYVYSPGYILFLKLYSLIFPATRSSIVIFQIILTSILNTAIFFSLTKLTKKWKAFFISLFPVFFAPLLIFSLRILPVAIWPPLFILSLLLLFISIKNDQNRYFYIGSSLLVLASLMRPNLFLLVPVIVILFFFVKKLNYKAFAPLVLCALLLGMIGTANYFEKGEFIPLTANGGVNFFMGNNPLSDGVYLPVNGVRDEIGLQLDDSVRIYANNTSDGYPTMQKASSWWFKKGLSFIIENPGKATALYLKKTALMFRNEEFSSSFSTDLILERSILPFYGFSFLLGLFVVFVILSFRYLSRMEKMFTVACLFFSFAGVVAFIIDSRYRLGFSVAVLTLMMILIAKSDLEIVFENKKKNFAAFIVGVLVFTATSFPKQKGNLYFAWYSLGNLQVEQEDWDSAEVSFSRSAKDNPDYSHAWNNLGMTQLMKKDYGNAQKAFEKALEIEPENQMFKENLKRSQGNQGR